MWSLIRKPITGVMAPLMLLGTLVVAHADVAPYEQVRLGSPVEAGVTMHRIAIGQDTHAITVHNGENVIFDVKGREVAWHFDAIAADMTFDLADLTPDWIARGQVQVLILAPSP